MPCPVWKNCISVAWRTFKNSLVYPVGAKHVDVEAQLDSIMQDICRFLNDQGGVVYIGMSDKGIPVGIQADLDYLCCNLDKYELFLHQRIKEAFGEEVDRTIQIERKQFGSRGSTFRPGGGVSFGELKGGQRWKPVFEGSKKKS